MHVGMRNHPLPGEIVKSHHRRFLQAARRAVPNGGAKSRFRDELGMARTGIGCDRRDRRTLGGHPCHQHSRKVPSQQDKLAPCFG